MSEEISERLSGIEARLERLENLWLGKGEEQKAAAPAPATPEPPEAAPTEPQTAPGWNEAAATQQTEQWEYKPIDWSVAKIMGWGGATALVIAAAYLVRLAWGGGWLTPTRQITIAIIAGISLIAAGIRFKDSDKEYASLLPAGGIVIFFLAVYGAHLYHEIISIQTAWVLVVVISAISLALCLHFASQLYSFFAVIGSYSAPFLLGDSTGALTDLIVYYSCWSVIFSAFSIWQKDRRIYLLALYLSLVGFDLLWKLVASDAWIEVVVFQFIQLLIFVTCATYYSARHNEPMSTEIAIAHAPALVIFYALEYAVLDANVPALAPWIAVASAGVLLAAYFLAKRKLHGSMEGSKWLLGGYSALVLLHAGYLESTPAGLKPWVAMLLIAAAGAYIYQRKQLGILKGPIGWTIGLIFAANYMRLITSFSVDEVPASNLLLLIFSCQIYTAYYFVRESTLPEVLRTALLYAGHIALMVTVMHYFDNRYLVAFTWGLIALAAIWLSRLKTDDELQQSSLPIFGAAVVYTYATGFLPSFNDDISGLNKFLSLALGCQYYLAYQQTRSRHASNFAYTLLVHAGHLLMMYVAALYFDNRFAISISWGVLALGSLILALRYKDRLLGQSSLLIFAIFVIKVFIFDIADATPVIRVASLAALGVSLYGGGWLYKKVDQLAPLKTSS